MHVRSSALIVALVAVPLPATAAVTLVSDGFESYAPGILDKNMASSANPAPNGGGQPWWGPGTTPNFNVISGSVGAVSPHSGTQMIRGNNTSSVHALLWNNLAYRDNAGSPLAGNLKYDFWFYDPNGTSAGSSFRGNSALAFYDKAPTTTDYPADVSPPTLSTSTLTTIQRLSLGAANYQTNESGFPQTYSSTKYQARLIGSTIGYNSAGWINLPITRSVGWHHGQILVGPADANGFNAVSYFIDDLTTPLLTGTTNLPNGYNTLEFVAEGSAVAYFDDVTLVSVPEPGVVGMGVVSVVGLGRLRRRR